MHSIYERYPMMRPFVGKKYLPGGSQSLLLIGESHYLPSDDPTRTQHLTAESWYRGNSSTLTTKEVEWISTADIIAHSSAAGFRDRAHSIYRKSFFQVNESGPKYPDYRSVGDIVVFCNYFLRPAYQGVSLRVEAEDQKIAEEVFKAVFDEYRPSAVVFLSKLAFRSWQASSNRSILVPVVAIPHPGCAYWNRICGAYGGKRGRELLGEFIGRLWHQVATETSK